jgi:predicted permease
MAVSKLGAAAVPINLILLGAALSQGPLRGELPRLNCLGVVLARLVLMPLGGLAVARALAARITVPAEVADPSPRPRPSPRPSPSPALTRSRTPP